MMNQQHSTSNSTSSSSRRRTKTHKDVTLTSECLTTNSGSPAYGKRARSGIGTSPKLHFLFALIALLCLFTGHTSAMTTRPMPTAIYYSKTASHTSAAPATSSTSKGGSDIVTQDGESTAYQVPRAFDTSVASDNFTSPGCLPFFNQFLTNDTFISCQPFSFLIKTSKSWFDITRSGYLSVTKALDATCNVDLQVCSAIMNDFAQQLLKVETCGAEFKSRNPVVTQAYASFITYDVMYKAGCQKDNTGYCYAEAITNSTNISDYVVYYVPLGISIPGGSRLTCNKCLQQTMQIFSTEAINASQPLYDTYTPSAQIIDIGCGPSFVSTTAEYTAGSSSTVRSSYHLPYIISIVMALFLII